MADTKITDLTELDAIPNNTDEIAIAVALRVLVARIQC